MRTVKEQFWDDVNKGWVEIEEIDESYYSNKYYDALELLEYKHLYSDGVERYERAKKKLDRIWNRCCKDGCEDILIANIKATVPEDLLPKWRK